MPTLRCKRSVMPTPNPVQKERYAHTWTMEIRGIHRGAGSIWHHSGAGSIWHLSYILWVLIREESRE